MVENTFRLGCERFFKTKWLRCQGRRIGLFTHLAAVDAELVPTIDRVAALDGLTLAAIFTPEHVLYGVAQAGQEIGDELHPRYGMPVYSLYGTRKKPTPEMLAGIDLLMVDFQDLGLRFYTYISALGYLLEAAAEQGVPVLVLDRPNPLTGTRMEGALLQPECQSYVGRYRIPLRFGLTVGELALWLAAQSAQPLSLDVVPVEGWSRAMWHDDTGRAWVPPSPNMPTLDTAIVYPGLALLEGTNVSEGRGATKPFELFGAPWIDSCELIAAFHELGLPGVRLREACFVPTFSKYRGQLCKGAQVHVTDRTAFQPLATGMHLLQLIARLHPQDFRWTDPVNGRHFLDLLCGTPELRLAIERGEDLHLLNKRWERETEAFSQNISSCFLYS